MYAASESDESSVGAERADAVHAVEDAAGQFGEIGLVGRVVGFAEGKEERAVVVGDVFEAGTVAPGLMNAVDLLARTESAGSKEANPLAVSRR